MKRIFTSLLLFCMALASYSVIAAETGIDGTSNTGDVTVDAVQPVYENLASTNTVTIPAGFTYECAVTCSSTVNNPKDADSDTDYYYGIGTTATAAASGSIRRFSWIEEIPDIDDAEKWPVSSTFLFSATGTVSFYCLAAKAAVGELNFVVDSTSQTVICSDIAF